METMDRQNNAENDWGWNTVFRDFPTFSRICIFFWLLLFSDLLSSTLLCSLTLPISAFHLSMLSEVWLLSFLRIPFGIGYTTVSFAFVFGGAPSVLLINDLICCFGISFLLSIIGLALVLAVGSLKWRVRGHLARWEMKTCTLLWREAHLQVKKLKTPQVRTTLGSWDVGKVHAVVARSAFRSQNAQNTQGSDHFWKLRFGPLLEVAMSKKCTPLWRSTFGTQNVQNTTCSRPFWRFRCVFAWQAQGMGHLLKKWAKREGYVAFPKTMAGVGNLKRICKDAFSVARAVQATFSSELLGGQGADFLRGVAFWSIRSSGLLRCFCVTGAALRMTWHHFCVAGAVV